MQKDKLFLVELSSDEENTHEISSSFIQSLNVIYHDKTITVWFLKTSHIKSFINLQQTREVWKTVILKDNKKSILKIVWKSAVKIWKLTVKLSVI